MQIIYSSRSPSKQRISIFPQPSRNNFFHIWWKTKTKMLTIFISENFPVRMWVEAEKAIDMQMAACSQPAGFSPTLGRTRKCLRADFLHLFSRPFFIGLNSDRCLAWLSQSGALLRLDWCDPGEWRLTQPLQKPATSHCFTSCFQFWQPWCEVFFSKILKSKYCQDFGAEDFVKILKLKFFQDF